MCACMCVCVFSLRVEALVGLAGLLHQGRAVVVQAQAVAVAPAVARPIGSHSCTQEV